MRRIVPVDQARLPDDSVQVTAALWLVAPANRIVPRPGFVSIVPLKIDGPTWGITLAELAELRAGVIVEAVVKEKLQSTDVATIQADLAGVWTREQAHLNETEGPSKIVGVSWDGTSWTG